MRKTILIRVLAIIILTLFLYNGTSAADDFYFKSKKDIPVVKHPDIDKEQKQLEQERKELESMTAEAERLKKTKEERECIQAEKKELVAMVPKAKCKKYEELRFLLGVWEDSDGHSRHKIIFANKIYIVASVIDDDGEVYEMRDSKCQNDKLTWSTHIPSTGYNTRYEMLLPSSSASVLSGFASNDHGVSGRKITFKKHDK